MGGSVIKLLMFGILLLGCLVGVYAAAYKGYGTAFFVGLFAGLSAWGVASGAAGLAKKELSWAVVGGIVGVVTLLCVAAGPSISASARQSKADDVFAKLREDGETNPERWNLRYSEKYEEAFLKPEWFGHYTLARVRKAVDEKQAVDLRNLMKEIDDHDGDDDDTKELLEEARHDAEKAFSKIYDEATAKMFKAVGSKKREFPVDPALRGAFATMLQGLSSSTDANVYVAFVNEAKLDPPEGTDKLLKQMQRHPDARAAFPKGNAPVISEGKAFSTEFDNKRRQTFITAMNESFHQVFESDGLFTLVPLKEGDDRDGKLIFEVSSTIFRIKDFFFYDKTGTDGIKRFAGFLFAIEVDWGFRILDRKGKVLYAPKHLRSSPAESLSVRRKQGDPTWSMYSVMMDSAYYNYARRVVGNFGLTPPPVKKAFSYSGPISE